MRRRDERISEAARTRVETLRRALDSAGLPKRLERARGSALEAKAKAAGAARRALAPAAGPTRRGLALAAPYVAAGPVLVADGIGALTSGSWQVTRRVGDLTSGRIAPALARALAWVERVVDPYLAALGLALIGGFGLAASQFLDYRGVSIGGALYGGQVALDAPPPITATETAGQANLWVPVALGVLAVACTALAASRQRRRLGLVVATLGVVGLSIALALDLPRGLDGEAARPYGSAQVLLLEGFWIQACAGVALVVAGLGIARLGPPAPADGGGG